MFRQGSDCHFEISEVEIARVNCNSLLYDCLLNDHYLFFENFLSCIKKNILSREAALIKLFHFLAEKGLLQNERICFPYYPNIQFRLQSLHTKRKLYLQSAFQIAFSITVNQRSECRPPSKTYKTYNNL